ncbi:DUF2795 domain-containing protein [Paraburkholderia sp. B3]|uniref:DUF2795 domain-containing protein n=1 Tax=Paraburkholderia sp. B3 TaxID=3134791 RepID=UPI003981EC5E
MYPSAMYPSVSAATDAAARQDFKRRIASAIAQVSYPAHPLILIETAEHSGAARDVVDALRALPDEAFGSFSEVAASIEAARGPASGLDPNCAS